MTLLLSSVKIGQSDEVYNAIDRSKSVVGLIEEVIDVLVNGFFEKPPNSVLGSVSPTREIHRVREKQSLNVCTRGCPPPSTFCFLMGFRRYRGLD